MLPLVLFADDTSGNRSKKWHKLESWFLRLAGLPSDLASCLEIFFLFAHLTTCQLGS